MLDDDIVLILLGTDDKCTTAEAARKYSLQTCEKNGLRGAIYDKPFHLSWPVNNYMCT